MANPVDINFKVNGLEQVDARLRALGAVAGSKVMKKVMFAAAKPIWQQARTNIKSTSKRGSGALARATGRAQRKPTGAVGGGSLFVIAIAPKRGNAAAIALANRFYRRTKPIKGIYWGHMVERGSNNVKSGSRIAGKYVYRDALSSKKDEAIALFGRLIGPEITKAAAKKGK